MGADFDVMAERHRWFDYYLKGIDNGIGKEKQVYYYTQNAPKGREWQFSETWPLKNEQRVNYYFGAGRSGSVNSVNDGVLVAGAMPQAGQDVHTSRYDISVFDGKFSLLNRRWDGDMTAGVDARGLTYTTPALATEVQVTGHPVVHLSASSTAPDAYFFAWLEDVDESGKSTFVTDGKLNASHRAETSHQPESKLGIPYHSSFQRDIEPMPPGKVVELAFDLFPTSYGFRSGHRIRVTIADASESAFPVPPAGLATFAPLVLPSGAQECGSTFHQTQFFRSANSVPSQSPGRVLYSPHR